MPWEVPKLRKKLQSRKKKEEFIQGSDSGISMSSQETREPAPWLQLQAPKLRRRLELDDNGGGGAAPVKPGSGSDGESRRSLCLSHEQASNSSVAANAEFLVQSYPGPRPASMVSASLGIGCRSTVEDGGEREAGAVKLGEEIADQDLEELGGNGESFQPPPDISDLPFSMPKLARRLGQPPSSSSPSFKLQQAPRPSLSLNIAPPSSKACSSQPSSPTSPLRAKPFKTRPMSLVQENPLNLPQHNRPGEKTFPEPNFNLPPRCSSSGRKFLWSLWSGRLIRRTKARFDVPSTGSNFFWRLGSCLCPALQKEAPSLPCPLKVDQRTHLIFLVQKMSANSA